MRAGCALAALALSATACSAPAEAPPTLVPTPIPTSTVRPPNPTPPRVPTIAPTATQPPPTPTASRVPPTPTLEPVLPLRITAQLDPPTPHAGEEFVLALSVIDDGLRAARGVYIATSGPWDRWTVLSIEPSGTFARDAAGWHIVSAMQVPPAETRTLQVHVRADEPAQEQLTFAVREAEPGELPPP